MDYFHEGKDLKPEELLALHQTALENRKRKLKKDQEQIDQQRLFLHKEKKRLLFQHAILKAEKIRFEASKHSDWFTPSAVSQEPRLSIAVGGKVFELSVKTAMKDPYSLLAAMVKEESPMSATEKGCFSVDRDWWVFRHILNFLRDGILPHDPATLKLLYLECDFWKLNSIKNAIEERKLNVSRKKRANHTSEIVNAFGKNSFHQKREQYVSFISNDTSDKWWNCAPSWWGTKDERGQKSIESKTEERSSWWTGAKYNGKDYDRYLRKTLDKHTSDTPVLNHSTWTRSNIEHDNNSNFNNKIFHK